MFTPQTHLSRRATFGRAVNIKSGLSLAYAMAGSFISAVNLDGRLQPAGLEIST